MLSPRTLRNRKLFDVLKSSSRLCLYVCASDFQPAQAPYLAGCCFGRGCGRRRWRLINEWNKYFLVSLLLVKSAAGLQRNTERV